MSSATPTKGHRHTRSVAIPGIAASSQNPRNPHHLNQHAHAGNNHSESQNYSLDSIQQPTTPPRTPRKDNQPPSHPLSSSAASGTGSKQKSRNKNRPKNVLTSPITTRKDRITSPFSGMQSAGMPSASKPMNTPSTAAYAGPTFHASPAPSALPIPSFYSKSVPDSLGAKGLKFLKGDHLATPPHATPAAGQSQREESPLDFFFKADREEKARAHSATLMAAATGPFQPPDESVRTSQTPPASSNQSQPRQGSGNRTSAGGIFAMEMDGEKEAGTPYGPAFSTPYSERINAARNNQQSRSSEQQAFGVRVPLNKTEALKAYLFSGTSVLSPTKEEDPVSAGPLHSNAYQSLPSTNNGLKSAGLPQRSYPNGYQYGSDSNHQSSNTRTPARSSGLRQEVASTKAHIVQYHNDSHTNSPAPSRRCDNVSFSDTSQANKQAAHGTSYLAGLSSGNRSADLLGMEDSLRKLLKLDSAGSTGVTHTSVGSRSAAVASLPNNVGGRPQRTNGTQSGFTGS
jgi:hypothetical protein